MDASARDGDAASEVATRTVRHGPAWAVGVVAWLLAFAVRAELILISPSNFSFDAFQRWAGRDVLLVQGWLPTTQALIHAVSARGGGVVEVRMLLAAIAALGVAAGALAAEKLGGRVAAWGFVVLSCFAPAMVWTGAMYQEGTYLAVLYLGLALAVHDRLRLADLVIGAIGLVRYEGWPAVLLWMLWRRDPRALAAGWGIAVWILGRYAFGWRGHAFSPVDFDDWEELARRTTLATWSHDAGEWLLMEWLSGGFVVLGFAAAGMAARWRDRWGWIGYMAVNLAAQTAALAGWLAGLEVATYRMLVVPTAVAALPAAMGVAWTWDRLPRWRVALVLGLAGFLGVASWEAHREARVEARGTSPERRAATLMRSYCKDCRWRVLPRVALGTRSRHDGCEILQGTTELRAGVDFVCMGWPESEAVETQAGIYWNGESYSVSTTGSAPDVLLALQSEAQRRRVLRKAAAAEDEETADLGEHDAAKAPGPNAP